MDRSQQNEEDSFGVERLVIGLDGGNTGDDSLPGCQQGGILSPGVERPPANGSLIEMLTIVAKAARGSPRIRVFKEQIYSILGKSLFNDSTRCLLDTGATLNGTNDRNILLDKKDTSINIQGINSTQVYDTKGTLYDQIMDTNGKSHSIIKEGAILIPAKINGETVLSYSRFFRQEGYGLNDVGEHPYLIHLSTGDKIPLHIGPDGLFYVDIKFNTINTIKKGKVTMDISIFHEKVGHINAIPELHKRAKALKITLTGGKVICQPCMLVNYQKQRIKSIGISRRFNIIERLFLDLTGPIKVWNGSGWRPYYLGLFMCDATRYAFPFIASHKSTSVLLPIYDEMVVSLSKFGTTMVIRTDMEKANWSDAMMKMWDKRGIQLEGTGANTPENNSVEGRIWRSFKKLCTMYVAAGMSGKQITIPILEYSWEMASYYLNNQETRANGENASPYAVKSALTGQQQRTPIDVVFGELVIIRNGEKQKIDMTLSGKLGMIVGVNELVAGKRGCNGAARVQQLDNGAIISTQHYEKSKSDTIIYALKQGSYDRNQFDAQFKHMISEMEKTIRKEDPDEGVTVPCPLIYQYKSEEAKPKPQYLENALLHEPEGDAPILRIIPEILEEEDREELEGGEQAREEMDQAPERDEDREDDDDDDPKSIRNVEPPIRFSLEQEKFAEEHIIGRHIPKGETRSGHQRILSEREVLFHAHVFKTKEMDVTIPKSYKDIERLQDQNAKQGWYDAVEMEIEGLMANGTLLYIKNEDMVKGIPVIKSGFVFDLKENGTLKSRFVAKEYVRTSDYSDQQVFAK